MIDRFADVLAPVAVDEFLRTYGTEFLHIPGGEDKFRDLLPWDQINLILAQHRLEHPRLRLAREGTIPSREAVLDHVQSHHGHEIPRLRAADLIAELRSGATMVIDAVDETYDPVARLAEDFERVLREHVQVNAYFGSGTTHGFNVHWDDHDVFALQLVGRKRWTIYGQTRKHPLYRDAEPTIEPPETVIWDHILEAGDVLYVPRGWWHMAAMIGEPTLHLTFGVNNRTGIHLLDWLRDRLRASEAFRKDLPRFASLSDQRTQMAALLTEFDRLWTDDLLADFFDDHDAAARPRPAVGLPWSVLGRGLPDSNDALVRLTAVRVGRVLRDETAGTLSFRANGRAWTFALAAEPILSPLLTGRPLRVADLLESADNLSREVVLGLLNELVIQGLLSATAPSSD